MQTPLRAQFVVGPLVAVERPDAAMPAAAGLTVAVLAVWASASTRVSVGTQAGRLTAVVAVEEGEQAAQGVEGLSVLQKTPSLSVSVTERPLEQVTCSQEQQRQQHSGRSRATRMFTHSVGAGTELLTRGLNNSTSHASSPPSKGVQHHSTFAS